MPRGGVNMKRTGITALMMAVSFPIGREDKIRLNASLKNSSKVSS
jgi:hypothetical protein